VALLKQWPESFRDFCLWCRTCTTPDAATKTYAYEKDSKFFGIKSTGGKKKSGPNMSNVRHGGAVKKPAYKDPAYKG